MIFRWRRRTASFSGKRKEALTMRIDEKEYSKSFELKTWLRLGRFMKPYKNQFITVFVLNIFAALIDICLPLFQRYAINTFVAGQTTDGLGLFALLYTTAIVVQTIGTIVFCRLSMKNEMYIGRDMKHDCFVHLQTLSLSYYNVTPVGYILARVMSDTNRIAGMLAWQLPDMLWQIGYVLGVFVAMLFLNVKLALTVMIVVPLLVLLTVYFQKRILLWNRRIRKQNSKITSAYNEGIMGAKTSKTLVIEKQNCAEFEELTTEMRIAGVRAARLRGIFMPLVLLLSSTVTAIVLNRGGHMVIEGVMLIGTLSAFTTYAIGIFEPIQHIAGNISEMISAQANIERVMDLLDEKPMITDTPEVIEKYGTAFEPKKENWEPIKGEIEFKDVSFKYPDGNEEILSHFNLHIPAGTTIAIVGETGAGKSTLVNLACRFFEPTAGQILIDGKDYRERSQLWLHSSLGYVLQSPHLFSGTVMENIRYGRLDATDEEV